MADLNRKEFDQLLEDLLNDEISSEEKARFEDYLKEEDYRLKYIVAVQQESFVRRVYENSDDMVKKPVKKFPLMQVISIAAAACLILVFSLGKFGKQEVEKLYSSVIVTNQVDCLWNSQKPVTASLPNGLIELKHGLAELKFTDGSTALLEAPLKFEVKGDAHLFLAEGNIFVHGKPGFRIDTAEGDIIDHGTKFGVSAGQEKSVVVQVYEGEVETITGKDKSTRLTQGDAVKLSGKNQEKINFKRERFVQIMPKPPRGAKSGKEYLVPYNVPSYESLTVNKRTNDIEIDGDLSDWEGSRKFTSQCRYPYSKNYFVEGYMKWDEEGLYIAAKVGDLHPMNSKIEPTPDQDFGWLAGAVQVRISLDREMGWPAQGVRVYKGPATNNPKLHHLTMWYYEPDKMPSLHLEQGIQYENKQVNPAGYKGAFKKFPDEKGYSMEYFIPWNLIPGDIPKSGDVLAGCWNFHWGDKEGTNWKGRLLECINPNGSGENFEYADAWGKLIFE